jgi:hypothetical protein
VLTNQPYANQPYASHVWLAAGDYVVVLRAFNQSYPAGVSAAVTLHVVTPQVHYVSAGSTNPVVPYTSWATAATNIQDAVDAATVAGALVLVTNGLYADAGRTVSDTVANQVTLDKPLTLRGVNGPQFTLIDGAGSFRCVSLTNYASLSGFTLTNGVADRGGGVWCASATAVVSNCVVVGNRASDYYGNGYYGGGAYSGTLNECTLSGNSAGADGLGGGAYDCVLNNCTLTANTADAGGGASGGTLNNCRLTGNSAGQSGGGVFGSMLNNCTLSANSASYGYGGGASGGTLNNCVVYANTAPHGANYDSGYSTLNYCCTTPRPTNGVGNITSPPLFVNQGAGNLRLQSNSPCINAGNNAYAPAGPDLDGNPRIAGGTVDIGAYEFQAPSSVISYAWLQQYGLPTDGSADYADPDHDGMNNWQEWIAGTDPNNAASVLRMLAPAGVTNGPGVILTWQSVSGISYFIERSTGLGAQPAFSLLQSNIVGQVGTTTCTDANAAGPGPFFYRVGVGNE